MRDSPQSEPVQAWISAVAERPTAAAMTLAALTGALVAPLAAGGDAHTFQLAEDQLLSSHGWDIFSNPYLQVGPTYLLLLGLLHLVAGFLHLPASVVAGAVQSLLVTWLALRCVRSAWPVVAERPTAAWAVGLALVTGGPLTEALLNGHPEELATGLLLVLAGQQALERRSFLPVALAGTSKLWGLLGVVVLLVGAHWTVAGLRLFVARVGGLGLLVALAYVPFFLFGDVETFREVWLCDRYSPLGLLTGYVGPAPFAPRLGQMALSVAVGTAFVARRSRPELVVLGVVCVRLLTDPLRQSYYWAELLLLVLVVAWSSTSSCGPRLRLAVAVAAPVVVVAPYLLPEVVTGWAHTLVTTALLAAAGWSTLASVSRSAKPEVGRSHVLLTAA